MSDELTEWRERAEAAEHDPLVLRVSVTMAVLAVVLSCVTLLSHRAHTEEILKQNQASDRWSYMQAKDIRRHMYGLFAEAVPAKKDDYTKQSAKYKDDVATLQKEAENLEHERDEQEHRATRFDIGEVMLEAAIVMASLALLTKQRFYWFLSIAVAMFGAAVAATGYLIHVG